jgi:hypothetical protein
MNAAEIIEDTLVHYGVTGMKWGVRKEYKSSAPTRPSRVVKGTEHYPKSLANSMNDVSNRMNKAYGYKVAEFVPLTEREARHGIAYVRARSKTGNVIHMTNDPKTKPMLDELQKAGWFVPTVRGKSVEGMITHESAHGLFHQAHVQKIGKIRSTSTTPAMDQMRKSAWTAAREQAVKDGDVVPGKGLKKLVTPSGDIQMAKKISKYAEFSMFIEEAEAEMFTAYHWSPDPPKFVDAFMNDVHGSMGKKVKPFSGRKT